MMQYINTIYLLFSNLIYVLFFCYLYHPIYISCNVQKKIKKNGKSKIVSQPKSVLALVNLILLYILFRCFTFKIIIFIILSIIICSLVLFDRLTPKLNDSLYNFNKSSIMIISWKLIHTVFTLIYVVTQPIYFVINRYVDKKITYIKNIITHIANLNFSKSSESSFESELLKISEEMSNVSDYIFKSQKNEQNTKIKGSESTYNISSSQMSNLPINNEIGIKNETPETSMTSSKLEMIKKIDEINNVINESNNNEIEDITMTMTEK